MRIHLRLFFAVSCVASVESFLKAAPASASLKSPWGVTEKRKSNFSPSFVPPHLSSENFHKDHQGWSGRGVNRPGWIVPNDASSYPNQSTDGSNDEDQISNADCLICGGGPAGLLSAIMMAKKFPDVSFCT